MKYIEHRLARSWRGQVQRMADNLSADGGTPEFWYSTKAKRDRKDKV